MPKTFTVDARSILTLGRDSIKDHKTALVELVKNSYDADAKRVEVGIFVDIPEPYIRVADNGHGMTEGEVEKYWLRIGFSHKVDEKVSSLNRRKTGEKGIGRLAADRLGGNLTLVTKSKKKVYGLKVDWTQFEPRGVDLTTIQIEETENPTINIPSTVAGKEADSGTELIITNLRQRWVKEDIDNLRQELTLLISPFKKRSDFHINIDTDVEGVVTGSVESGIYETYRLKLTANFDGKKTVKYCFSTKENGKKKTDKFQKINWSELLQKSDRPPKCGPVNLNLLFFPQKKEILEGTEFSISQLKEFLQFNAGISIYRDDVRVKPYGNPKLPEGDWLGLGKRVAKNPAGAGRASFTVSPNSLVGAVFLGRDRNPNLTDSSSREGLIQGEGFADLKSVVLGCVRLLELRYHDEFTKEKEQKIAKPSPTEEVKALNKELRFLKRDLRTILPVMAGSSEEVVERAMERVENIVEQIQGAQQSIIELASQTTVYRGLATIGIAASVFGHETQISIDNFFSAAETAKMLLEANPPSVDMALEELSKSMLSAERVAAWGVFALTRTKRDKRRKKIVNIKTLIEDLIKEISPSFESADITIEKKLESVTGKTFAMDVEAILLNLLTNSYSACQLTQRKRMIRVELSKKLEDKRSGFKLTVSDSGPGVAEQFRDRIWDPLYSNKVDNDGNEIGTGLGLTIIRSILEDLQGKKSQSRDPQLGGARFGIWLPLD